MPMAGKRHEIARMRAELHRDSYKKLLRILIYLNVLALILMICLAYVIFFQPAPTYYATTSTGLIIPLGHQPPQ